MDILQKVREIFGNVKLETKYLDVFARISLNDLVGIESA